MNKAQPIDERRAAEKQSVSAAAPETSRQMPEREASAGQSEEFEEPQAAAEGAAGGDHARASEFVDGPEAEAVEPDAAGEEGGQRLLPHVLPSPAERRALLEAIVYVAEEPLAAEQIAAGLQFPLDVIQADLDQLAEESQAAARGIEIRKVAGGYKMFTKAEHHEAIRQFVKTLRPKLRLSLPALETLAVIAYKQPATVPEIQAIRGVNAGGVIHTLLNHKLINTAGRKKVIGRPMQYKTTKEFLVQFGLNDLSELPNLKELEELGRAALGEGEELEGSPLSAVANTDAQPAGEALDLLGMDDESDAEAAAVGAAEELADSEQDDIAEPQESASLERLAAASAAAGAGAAKIGYPARNKDSAADSAPDSDAEHD